jgi:predicted alpha/beta superfamily hydrolase
MASHQTFLDKWLSRGHPAPGSLEIIDDVYSPELGNHRDVLVYTPASYASTDDRYPVLYMHDGQNLFDPTTSFAGEWGVDAALAHAPRRGRRAIVVGIPNMGVDRMKEYSPFADTRHGGGGGDAYIDFIVNTLKPTIDARYRTRPDRESTGILGSSLGGLISLYAFFRAPHRFGFAGVMSPALWFADGAIFPWIEGQTNVGGRIYLDVGGREGAGTLANARAMRDLLERKGYHPGHGLQWVEDDEGVHNEACWGRRLRDALPFLLNGPDAD